eukprot:snap_masked-scaffold_54-processed-gene-1.42-mRNA-1 protein AED:1.00 eAED:1.00 QI:0/-1/0/0/-1/1/1/0/623
MTSLSTAVRKGKTKSPDIKFNYSSSSDFYFYNIWHYFRIIVACFLIFEVFWIFIYNGSNNEDNLLRNVRQEKITATVSEFNVYIKTQGNFEDLEFAFSSFLNSDYYKYDVNLEFYVQNGDRTKTKRLQARVRSRIGKFIRDADESRKLSLQKLQERVDVTSYTNAFCKGNSWLNFLTARELNRIAAKGGLIFFTSESDIFKSNMFTLLKEAHSVYGLRSEVSGFIFNLNGQTSHEAVYYTTTAPNSGFSPKLQSWHDFIQFASSNCGKVDADWRLAYENFVRGRVDHFFLSINSLKRLEPHLQYQQVLEKDSFHSTRFHGDLPLVLNPRVYSAGNQEVSTFNSVKFSKFLSDKNGFVNVQLLNSGYFLMTKHWICNVKSLDQKILDKTLFIATDEKVYTDLIELNLGLNVVFESFYNPEDLSYGQVQYFKMMLWRTGLIFKILSEGTNLFLTESDAVWFQDPFESLEMDKLVADKGLDILLMDDKFPEEGPQGGFMFLKSTKNTLGAWREMMELQDQAMRPFLGGDRSDLEKIGEAGNEQHLEKQVFFERRDKGVLNFRWMDPKKFCSGKWYLDKKWRSSKNVIVLFNWIVGSEEKIKRAKRYGHWYLGRDNQCKVPKRRRKI